MMGNCNTENLKKNCEKTLGQVQKVGKTVKKVNFTAFVCSFELPTNSSQKYFSVQNMFIVTKITWKTIVWKTRLDP